MKLFPSAIIAHALLTVGCATSSPSKTLMTLIDSGEARVLPYEEYSTMVVGNSLQGEGTNGGTTYYRDDGVKLVKNSSGNQIVREWHLNDSGILCQTLVKTNNMQCLDGSDGMKVAKSGNTIYLYNGNNVWSFEIKEGNSANLTQ